MPRGVFISLALLLFLCRFAEAYFWIGARRGSAEVVALAEDAIQYANQASDQLSRNPTDPAYRREYEEALQNLALARQAIEREFQLGLIDGATRTGLLGRLARLLSPGPTSLGDAINRSLEAEHEAVQRFVPKAIERRRAETIAPSRSDEFPGPVAVTGNTLVFLTSDLFPDGETEVEAFSPMRVESPSDARRKSQEIGGGVSGGYNAPTVSSGSRGDGLSYLNPSLDRPANPVAEVLAQRLMKSRERVETKAESSPVTSLAPGFESLGRALSGAGTGTRAAGPPTTGAAGNAYELFLKGVERGLAGDLSAHGPERLRSRAAGLLALIATTLLLVAVLGRGLWRTVLRRRPSA